MAEKKLAPYLADALMELWERSWKSLSIDDLHWFAKLSDQAESELRSVAEVVSDGAGRVGLNGTAGTDLDTIASLMYTAANTMRNAAAMSFVAGEASHIIENFASYHPQAATSAPAKKGGAK